MTTVGPGMTLTGRYRLDEHIAGGGMGDVWRGTDEVLGRTVAIKILLPSLLSEPGFAQRFRDEARTMATINHPGVVNVYDYGTDQGVTYLVMEYVEGDALSKTLTRVGRLTPARTMLLVAQAADALQAAHDKGIVHRDVKPANLLVRPNGTLVLTDFGIARSAAASQLTQAGSVLGTASYISPEQASGSTATPISDVYSLGVVAYQCLSGRRPFEGGSPIEIALQHVDSVPPPLPPDIPAPIRSLVERCLAKAPAARYQSAAALAAAARAAAAGQAVPGPARPVIPAAPPPRGATPGGAPVAIAPSQAPTQVVAPRPVPMGPPAQRPAAAQPRTAYPPNGYPKPHHNRVGVTVLAIVLAVLVMLLSALIASAIKTHEHNVQCSRTPTAVGCPSAGAQGAGNTWDGRDSWGMLVRTGTKHAAKVGASSADPADVV